MMNTAIQNIDDLKRAIVLLESERDTQKIAFRERFRSPAALVGSLLSLFPRSENQVGLGVTSLFGKDIIQSAARFVLPLALNKTLFRKSNFLVRAMVGVLSSKASKYITEDTVTALVRRVKGILHKEPSGNVTPADASPQPPEMVNKPII